MNDNAIFQFDGTQQDSNENSNFPGNKLLFIQQFSGETPIKPKMAHGIRSLQELIDYYHPTCNLTFTDISGNKIEEVIHFNSIEDFSPNNLVSNSSYLKEEDKIVEQKLLLRNKLQQSRRFNQLLNDPGKKKILKTAIQNILNSKKQIQ